MKVDALKVLVLLAVLAGCGPTIRGVLVYYPENAPTPAQDHVELHYLGNGGWLMRRGGDVIATAPFVTNPVGGAVYAPAKSDQTRIDRKLSAMRDVKTILLGHSHYDHAMDLPYIMRTLAPDAKVYGSETAKHLLGPALGPGRVVDMAAEFRVASGTTPGGWAPGPDSLVRFMALSSRHAPHVLKFIKVVSWAHLKEDVPHLPTVPAAWPEGETLAFLIDFMEPDRSRVAFRIYYQDAAAPPGLGVIPTLSPPDDAHVDVAILCVAAFDQVDGNPETILDRVKPRFVVGGHWEDFFMRSPDEPPRVAVGTSLEEFVRRTHDTVRAPIYIVEPGKKIFIPLVPR